MRRGFTAVELLVCITVVGAILAITLPAVQSAREAARMVECKNRVQQITLASLNFHDTHKHFPREGQRFGSLLPYVDQQNMYDALDLSNRYTDPDYEPTADAGSGSGFVTTFVCPSGGDDPARYEFSYAASQGSLPRNAVYDDKSAVFAVANGVADTHFRRGGKVTMQSVYDGASNTVFYAERRPIQAGERSWTADVVGLTAMRLATAANAATDFEIAENHKRRRFDDVHNSDYMHIVGPNGRACWFRNANGNYTDPALSYHTGGMNVSRVDGSVSFVSDEIDTKVWQDLGSRDQRIEQPLLKLWDGK